MSRDSSVKKVTGRPGSGFWPGQEFYS